jgi:Tat protein secretion system quality control protein TatD with DNase activity
MGRYRFAVAAQVPVKTILIETDTAYLSKGWPLFRKPPMSIHYRTPGSPDTQTKSQSDTLPWRVRAKQ